MAMDDNQFTPRLTEDGSYTFFSPQFQEAFHSSFGAKQEAEVRYIKPCLLEELAVKQSTIRILDVCYGLGYNSAAALDAIWAVNPKCRVELIALEIDADVPRQAVKHKLLQAWRSRSPKGLAPGGASVDGVQSPIPDLLAELSVSYTVSNSYIFAKLLLGDARLTARSLSEQVSLSWQADAIFLDPFSPRKCPQLWTVEFISLLSKYLAPHGRLATYSASAAVRTALISAGLKIGSVSGAGRKSPGTIASFEYKKLHPLSVMEQEHLQTRAAIPYRDRSLQTSSAEIINNRLQEQQNSQAESASKWRKRWIM